MRAHYADLWNALAAAVPEREAIRSVDGATWTYAQFARDAGALAATFAARGLRAGDRVALLLYNRPEFLVTVFACLAAGLIPVPLNYRLRAHELAALLDDAEAAALVAPTSLQKTTMDAAAGAISAPELLWIPDDGDASPGWAQATASPAPLPSPPDDAELWLYTGGTTGRPKAVRWDEQEMFEAQMAPTYSVIGLEWPRTIDEAVRIAADPRTPHVVTLPLSPFLHGTALTTSMNTLTLGGTVLVTSSPRLDADAAVRFAAAASATRLIVAGDGVTVPLVEAAERLGIRLPAVQTVISSGMRFSPETKRRLHALGDMTIMDMLASTEGGVYASTTTTGADDLPGRPQLFPSAVVLDQDLHEVQDRPGALGILAQRGALPLGYHGDPDKTAATFPVIAGVRHVMPGDWVRVEDDRHIEFLGRGSGVINTGGEKVYPLEVEEVLLEHPAVADAVVLGAPDARFGEVVTAVVARRREVTVDELLAFVDERLAGYKRPRHILFRASLDRTPTGKVDMAELRDEVVREM
ncbi:acyl-CoA synthetase [Microbacterium protaetiae]|uniref:Acyl-CoA synthetase n=1 Tax=Microbacterium protaetiae TaxID=2509458 RepID=A0A4P6EFH8_9MICO|nr:AMP-binding protein [Microbacterium protaetiae]QAY58857.1 acyl-CoA synthetase [Microbacterium protaetiae]